MQTIAAIDEHSHVVAGSPDGHSPVLKTTWTSAARAGAVCLGIERPQLFAGLGVKGHDARIHRSYIDYVLDHERGGFEAARAGVELLIR